MVLCVIYGKHLWMFLPDILKLWYLMKWVCLHAWLHESLLVDVSKARKGVSLKNPSGTSASHCPSQYTVSMDALMAL